MVPGTQGGDPTSYFLGHRPHPALGCAGQATSFSRRGCNPRNCWIGARTRGRRMGKFCTTPGQLSLLAALVPRLVQAQPLAQRKSWLVGLGAALAFLFLIFVLTLVYAVWCRESQDSSEEKEEETVRKEKGEDDWGLELEETEGPLNHEAMASSST
ncbi:small integral membrane protein 24-like isoform X1 [Bos indicus x Bos taurus]|uniref:small integral membrane protein 24-like isoform X1 n=1 Tax=Bos indicus x Bos taurus TaxID=30522 RepID=UPI000F7D0B88|nr:small integral membrane protein 24-like isoform X1 [Bos indicus x Bos taurus]